MKITIFNLIQTENQWDLMVLRLRRQAKNNPGYNYLGVAGFIKKAIKSAKEERYLTHIPIRSSKHHRPSAKVRQVSAVSKRLGTTHEFIMGAF